MRSLALSLLLSLLLSVLLVGRLEAADAKIQNLAAIAANKQVSVHFTLSNVFDDPSIVQGLQSGLATSFTFVVEIFRDRPNWLDEGISRSRIEITSTFNSVTREYLLEYRRDRRLVRSETFTDLTALEQRMTTIDERNLFEIGNRRPYKLKVRVKADLMRGWLLYFIPWEVSTHWRETRVKSLETKP